jgi:hypothetical protein
MSAALNKSGTGPGPDAQSRVTRSPGRAAYVKPSRLHSRELTAGPAPVRVIVEHRACTFKGVKLSCSLPVSNPKSYVTPDSEMSM